jgi:GNAT superfamily N-acetyltransferase
MFEQWSPDQRGRDMIVPLLALPDARPVMQRMEEQGIVVRRATMGELTPLRAFIGAHFSQVWADDVIAALSHRPASVFVAIHGSTIAGYASHSSNRPNVVGPLGVHPEYRERGVGTALLFQCLLDLRAHGCGYAIIGGVGPAAFYEKTCGALLLPAEWPSHDTPMRL